MVKENIAATARNPICLSAEKLSKTYSQDGIVAHALTEVSLSVASGEFMAIAGSSGSGKTTLLNLLGCLDSPSRGKIYIDGVDISTLSPKEVCRFRASKIGFIFQTFNLLPVLSAAENVEYPLLTLRISKSERSRCVAKALQDVGLEKYASHRPSQLSGGQRQRVAIARALVKTPKVILADEPTANLDKATAVGVLDLMRGLNQKAGVTFIFSSHDPLILSRAGRVLHLNDGRVTS